MSANIRESIARNLSALNPYSNKTTKDEKIEKVAVAVASRSIKPPEVEEKLSKLTTNDLLGMVSKDRILRLAAGCIAVPILPALVFNPVSIATAVGGAAAVATFAYKDRMDIASQASANLSLFKNKFHIYKYKWFDQANEHLYLGGIPLKNHDHIDIFKDEMNIGTVICLAATEELTEDSITHRPVRPEEWKDAGIHFEHFPTEDFVPLSVSVMDKVADYLNTAITKCEEPGENKKVYIHCKAGVGRTPTAYAGYLIKHKGYAAEDALKRVKEVRPSVNLNENQIKRIHEFEAHIKAQS
ncbi:MAG: hypothetical protein S4CHLAM37_11630 [Chlamydiia bacterium]|nr:hypothetical protein [Chlamydiia bacterium]